MMDHWTKTKGFPIVVVSQDESEDLNSQAFKFVQTSCHQNDIETVWKIPLAYIDSEGNTGNIIIEEKESKIIIPVAQGTTIKFNHNSTTFCQVIYNPTLLQTL